MEVREDVLVTEEGHLVISPGTTVVMVPSEGTRTDPHFFSTGTEIMVRGTLEARGLPGQEILFERGNGGDDDDWEGIILDGVGARGELSWVRITGARSGVTVVDSELELTDSVISGCEYGVTLLGGRTRISASRLEGNDYGLADYAPSTVIENTVVTGNRERDRLDAAALEGYTLPRWGRPEFSIYPKPGETEYLGEHSIGEDTDWEGTVYIRGQVVVQPSATLTIRPGTTVAFRRLDTNGDGLGESHLLILGTIRVLGTPENWVLFTSAEEEKRPGDWDKVSLIASDSPENTVRYARFEYGYQSFHSHFSSVEMTGVIFNNNYRGVQFQESARTSIDGAYFTGNKSAMRFRDSVVSLRNILVQLNTSGINFLRCRTTLEDVVITGSAMDPLLGRESETDISNLVISNNREGPRFKGEGSKLVISDTAVHHNMEDGLALSSVEARVVRSEISFNGLDGLSVTGGKVKVEDSSIRDNGRWAVDNNGEGIVEARGVFWGLEEDGKIEEAVFDRRDDPAVGRVLFRPFVRLHPGHLFPDLPPASLRWSGEIRINGDCPLPPDSVLIIEPGTRVFLRPLAEGSPQDLLREHPNFPGSELIIQGGSVEAAGTAGEPVSFSGPGEGVGTEGRWGAVNIHQADMARFEHCFFTGAQTGLHIQESKAEVKDSVFTGNGVGLRFHTTPILVTGNTFSENATGLRFHFGTPTIRGNRFQRNGTAIFISQDPGETVITGNDFIGSLDYHISLGEMVAVDIEATGNYWGGVDQEEISGKFYDASKWDHLGRVIREPAATSPVAGER